MIFGIGTDIVEVARIQNSIEKYGDLFLNRVFTEIEKNYCEQFKKNKYQHYAARFAAKEAFSKAIGTGITKGFIFTEIGIANEETGKPIVMLTGGMADKWSDYEVFVTLSHTDNNALAYLIIEDVEPPIAVSEIEPLSIEDV
ncbi:MAG: holo-[acyl-carrier protein] synthase [Bacteroidota bacterium]|nr:holo-[acyl-carrier protein] synthase [Bacteroidota bacterium]